jgi:glutamate formiminotransferase
MTLLGIPNISDGRRREVIERTSRAISKAGARVLDVHSDMVHDRSVITAAGSALHLVTGMTAVASICRETIDLRRHEGMHPRLGALDVCPIVPFGTDMAQAVAAARGIGAAIAGIGFPVYLYGHAARRDATRELPDIRRGGLDTLIRRAGSDLVPDLGPARVDPRTGVVCVGARDVLIAFNVWLRAPVKVARTIARAVRFASGGPPGLRALGLDIDDAPTSQVAMNLIDPERTGIDRAFEAVEVNAARFGAQIVATEIVGLVPERFLPDPDAQAARLLMAPGRSIEAALAG